MALIVASGFALRSSAAGTTTVGIDFNAADNTATSVGAITTCLEVPSGGSYTLDVYVQNVPGDTNPFTPDGMVAGQYTLNSTAGNTDTARTATGGFIDLGIGIGSPGTAAVDNTASTPVNNSTGADTIIASNDPAIGVSGAEGDGFFVRMTYAAPAVGAATIVPLTLTAVTLVDALANEIPVGVINNATLIVAPDGTTNCATLPTPTPPGQTPTPTPTRSPTPTATPPGQTPTPTPTPSATPTATPPGQTPTPTPTPTPTLTVVNTNDSGAGSLRQAIADAAPGDTIDFAPALSGQTITLTTGELLISKDLTITGPAGGIAISGNNVSRVFEISSGNVSMSDLTVTGGKSVSQGFQGWGGGILNNDRLALTNSTVSGNRADFGGGIFIGGSLTLTNSRVSSNNSDNSGGGIYLYYGEMTVTNSTIDGNTGGAFGAGFGGGILSRGATTLTDSTVSHNTGDQGGGGILSDNSGGGGSLTLTNSTVSDNLAKGSDGGGISNYGFGGLTLTNSTVSGNLAARFGGGIFSVSSTTITNSTIDSNSSGADGGGIESENAMTLTNSTVSRNTSRLRDGGGIYNHNGYGGLLTLINSTVSDNNAPQGSGGGIYNYNRPLTLINSTVSDNNAPHGSGSGIHNNDYGTLTLTNSIVANAGGGGDCINDSGGTTVSNGYNLDGDGTCNLTATGDLPGTNPMLDPLALNPPGTTETQALQLGSPAIDHIPTSVNGCGTTVSTDQRGVSRPQGSGCDIGAYELLNTATFSVTKVYTDGNTTAFVTIHLACTSGMITDNDQGVTGGGTLIFHVSGDAPPDGCTATETSVPVGYTSDSPCSDTITGAPSGSGSCTITNTQNTAAFTVTKVYSDGNTTAVVSISLTCANGTVTDSPQSVTGGGSVTFNVSGDTPPDSCTATETSVPADYTSDSPCSGTITGAPTGSGSCTITNTLNTATFKVTKVYSDGNTTAAVSISLSCSTGMVTDSPQSVTGGGSVTFNVSGDAPPDSCTASESGVPAGYTSDSPCSGTITGAPSGSGSCTITNTLNTATFKVTKVFSDGNAFTTVSIGLTCANGTVTDSPQSLTGSGSVTFHIKGDTPPDTCTAAETVPTGYTGSGSPAGTCSGAITGAPSGGGFCTITNTPTGRHDVGLAGHGLGFNAPNTVKAGHTTAIHIRLENFGSVTETQIGYRVVATCSGTCTGTVTLSAACTGTVGPVAPGVTFVVEASCTATATTAGDVWVLTLMVIHCGADGVFAGAPCTANDGAIDVNNSNNVAVTKVTVT